MHILSLAHVALHATPATTWRIASVLAAGISTIGGVAIAQQPHTRAVESSARQQRPSLQSLAVADKQPASTEGSSTESVQASSRKLKEGQHYSVYTGTGDPARLRDVVARFEESDVVLLGEVHDDSVAHALQLELLRRAHKQLSIAPASIGGSGNGGSSSSGGGVVGSALGSLRRPLLLSLEMFDRDVQQVMHDYLAGHIRELDLLRDARPWPNYHTDYRPLVELARARGLPVVCANAPRRFVSLVGRQGRDALSALPAASRAWLPPLPYSLPSQALAGNVSGAMQQAAAGMQRLRQQQAAEQAAGQAEHSAAQRQSAAGESGAGGAACPSIPAPQQATQTPDASAFGVSSGACDSAPAATAALEQPGSSGSGSCPFISLSLSHRHLDAQCLWDAAMAHSIATALSDAGHSPAAAAPAAGAPVAPPLLLHVCGKFHCEGRLGIPEHLAHYAPGARVMVVALVPAAPPLTLDRDAFARDGLRGSADFVVLTCGELPRSFASEHPI